jgi:hypothetical protein
MWLDASVERQLFEPRVLPQRLALGLAAAVVRTRAADAGQRHGIAHPAQAGLVAHVVDLVDATVNAIDPSAERVHLLHVLQAVDRAACVERRANRLARFHAHEIAGTKRRSEQASQAMTREPPS